MLHEYADGWTGYREPVEDDGPGIPPEAQEKILQPFFTTKPTGEGTGLGLAMTYGILARHGAPRTSTVPSGSMAASATPISPIMDSRPMVGVEKRLRTIAVMPDKTNKRVAPHTKTRIHHEGLSALAPS